MVSSSAASGAWNSDLPASSDSRSLLSSGDWNSPVLLGTRSISEWSSIPTSRRSAASARSGAAGTASAAGGRKASSGSMPSSGSAEVSAAMRARSSSIGRIPGGSGSDSGLAPGRSTGMTGTVSASVGATSLPTCCTSTVSGSGASKASIAASTIASLSSATSPAATSMTGPASPSTGVADSGVGGWPPWTVIFPVIASAAASRAPSTRPNWSRASSLLGSTAIRRLSQWEASSSRPWRSVMSASALSAITFSASRSSTWVKAASAGPSSRRSRQQRPRTMLPGM